MDDQGDAVAGYVYSPYDETLILGPGENGVLQWGYDLPSQPDDDQVLSTSAYGNPYQYTARRVDPETGLMYYRARMYDAGLGRFVSRDPIGDWGDAGNRGNGYAYVGGVPTAATDPSGLLGIYLNGGPDAYRECLPSSESNLWSGRPEWSQAIPGMKIDCTNTWGSVEMVADWALRIVEWWAESNHEYEPIVILGYSRGAQAALVLARELETRGI